MKTTQIRKIARNAGAVSFKTLKGQKMTWIACYAATAKDRGAMMAKMAAAGLKVETGHFGNQVDVEVA